MNEMTQRSKRELLSLYNAINEMDYKNPEELIITTLDNAIYMGMRNDLAFLIDAHYPCTNINLHITPICPFGIYSTFRICIPG